MQNIQLLIYVILLLGITFLISYLMEIYKKEIRKGKAKSWENNIVGLILSSLGVLLLNTMGVLKPILGQIGANIIYDYILYTIIFYIIQMQMSLKIIKKLTMHFISNFLENKGLNPEEIKKLLED